MRTGRIAHLLGSLLVAAMVSGCGGEEGPPPIAPGAPVPTPPPDAGKMFQKPSQLPKAKTGAVHSSPNALRNPSGSSHA
jgi:hypothetical protein